MQAVGHSKTLTIADGLAVPKIETVTFRSKVHRFDQKRKAKSLMIAQSPIWQNWEPIENLGPVNMQDAPVLRWSRPR